MYTWVKRLSGVLMDGMWLSGRPELRDLELKRDYADVDALMAHEEWPFVFEDVAVSHAQPKSTSLVAHKDGHFAGFFTTHHFGDIGYLDMMIIHPEYRRAGIARPLYFKTMSRMRRKGLRCMVVHTTNDSARIIHLLGFRPGSSFTLLVRQAAVAGLQVDGVETLGLEDEEAIDALDQAIFGMPRRPWIAALLRDGKAQFRGIRRDGALVAMLALRPRKAGAFCIDTVMGHAWKDVQTLVQAVLAEAGGAPLQCFARTDGELHQELIRNGFSVPDFFVPIGPLVEWRRGHVPEVGTSPHLHSLAWL